MSTADQARQFRFALRHSLLLAAVVGGLALVYVYGPHFNQRGSYFADARNDPTSDQSNSL
ncbi:MAG TPA: hypothetical protein VHZ25_03605 [Acidobacteriaceae bacterium]|jgi:hypothetical protein|nr:hypothetical protein [Acidobacteriaceae bacterium]